MYELLIVERKENDELFVSVEVTFTSKVIETSSPMMRCTRLVSNASIHTIGVNGVEPEI